VVNHSIEQLSAIANETSKAMGEASQTVDELARQTSVLQALINKLRREAGELG